MLSLDHANISFELTHECNYKCSYCLQGCTQNEKKYLNIKMFKLIVDKLFKSDLKSLSITLMGGELSTDEKYLEYFEYIFKKQIPNTIALKIDFLSNYSEDSFFKKLINLHKLYPNIKIDLILTLHKQYSINNCSKIISRLKEDSEYNNKNFCIDVCFLENFSKISKEDSYYKYYKNFFENSNKKNLKAVFTQLRKYDNCPLSKNPGKRLCNVLYYSVTPDGKITDQCRNITTNFINFKLSKHPILCNKACPCPFLEDDFTQKLVK